MTDIALFYQMAAPDAFGRRRQPTIKDHEGLSIVGLTPRTTVNGRGNMPKTNAFDHYRSRLPRRYSTFLLFREDGTRGMWGARRGRIDPG